MVVSRHLLYTKQSDFTQMTILPPPTPEKEGVLGESRGTGPVLHCPRLGTLGVRGEPHRHEGHTVQDGGRGTGRRGRHGTAVTYDIEGPNKHSFLRLAKATEGSLKKLKQGRTNQNE